LNITQPQQFNIQPSSFSFNFEIRLVSSRYICALQLDFGITRLWSFFCLVMFTQDLLPRSQPWMKSPSLSETSQVIGSCYAASFSPNSIAHIDARVAEALNSRDVVVQRLADACVSIRQKTVLIERLEKEKAELKETLSTCTGPGMSERTGNAEALRWEKVVCDLQEEIRALKVGRKDQPPEYDDVRALFILGDPSDI
jgi:hypothetical protein